MYVLLGKDTDVSLSVFDILSCDMRLSGPSMFENEFWKVALTMTAYVFGVVLPACMALELAVHEKNEWKNARQYELRREVTATLAGGRL